MKTVFKAPFKKLLAQGLDEHQLAQAICLGITVGMAPLVWGTSLLCILLAFRLRLNQVAVQVANYLAWPLQVLFIYPYFRGGMQLAGEREPMVVEKFSQLLAAGPTTFISALAWNNLWALLAWLLTVPLAAVAIYGFSRLAIRHYRKNSTENSPSPNRFLTTEM